MEMSLQIEPPWYRQIWPWVLIALPASAVVASFVTLWLAMHGDDSLVVDDYYKEGRAINQQLARDARASALGLSAVIARAPEGLAMTLSARMPMTWPERLDLRFVHATRAQYDERLAFRSIGGGHYVASEGVLPQSGHWILHLESPDGDWRLVEPLHATHDAIHLDAAKPAANTDTATETRK